MMGFIDFTNDDNNLYIKDDICEFNYNNENLNNILEWFYLLNLQFIENILYSEKF